jgi:uncharacterized membrane protein (DUF485 family)
MPESLKEEDVMSHELSVAKIVANPKYHRLVQERNSISWILSVVVLVMYYGFILMVAYGAPILTQPMAPDSVMVWGLPIGVAVIFFSCLTTAVYVYRSNSHFDPLIHDIIQELTK